MIENHKKKVNTEIWNVLKTPETYSLEVSEWNKTTELN